MDPVRHSQRYHELAYLSEREWVLRGLEVWFALNAIGAAVEELWR